MRKAAAGAISVLVSLLWAVASYALGTPQENFAKFHHTAWRVQDGAPPDVWALAQTPDGFLWLGTGAGLYRFDGVRFEHVWPSPGERSHDENITALLARPNGDLWIGGFDGLVARLRGGRLTTYPSGAVSGGVESLFPDAAGNVWAGLKNVHGATGGLERFDGRTVQVIGRAWGLPDVGSANGAASPDGALWVTRADRLWRLAPSETRFRDVGVAVLSKPELTVSRQGWLYLTDRGGLRRIVWRDAQAKRQAPEVLSQTLYASPLRRLLVMGDGAVWGSREAGGLIRLETGAPSASIRPYMLADGLTSDLSVPLLQDREGNVWVGTNLGLDRFRVANIAPLLAVPATSRDGFVAVAGAQGSVFVADTYVLRRIDAQLNSRVVETGLNGWRFACALGGNVWLGDHRRIFRLSRGRAREVPKPDGFDPDLAVGCIVDDAENLWVSADGRGLSYFDGRVWHPAKLSGPLPSGRLRLMARDASGRIWLCFDAETLAVIDHGAVHVFPPAQGPRVGRVEMLSADANVLLSGEGGIARYANGRFQTLGSRQIAPLDRVTGLVLTQNGDVWLSGITGAARIAKSELERAFIDPNYDPQFDLLDSRDGLPGLAQQDSGANTLVQSDDGRIWFVTNHGVAWADPGRLLHNPLPPPVKIRALISQGREFAFPSDIKLAAGVHNIEIDYTALSLAIPERVRFLYRLSGIDRTWVIAGARRQAFYTNLRPGNYTFQVIASNDSGIWNKQGAVLDFKIAPTFVETQGFLWICAVMTLSALWLLYYLRLRQLAGRMQALLFARIAERERIARDLHDTLLQDFQGLTLRLHNAARDLPAQDPTYKRLSAVLDRADEALVRGRDRVMALRQPANDKDFAAGIQRAAENAGLTPPMSLAFCVDGRARKIHPVVREELSSIGEEAVANAVRHSKARTICVVLDYQQRQLQLSVCDDGIGFDPHATVAGGERRFGLKGLRERSQRVRGELRIHSRPGEGARVVVAVPGRVAYRRSKLWTSTSLP